ncbi:hypothetical protein PIB30_049807 [Stylosanthes scabra]|uniref:Uncharacterized protein n=1 Tax=Stylosanthes scabra TaxID=79078 RepID=A0ABU6TJF1_9FABA|nr:hypothetical protein [Stylosanthes scabra]
MENGAWMLDGATKDRVYALSLASRKNGPPGKYERWLSNASSGSVGLAMITDRVSSP